MKKKIALFDNKNLQQDITWGNIALPGLPDDQLYSTDWRKSRIKSAEEKRQIGIKSRENQSRFSKQKKQSIAKKISENRLYTRGPKSAQEKAKLRATRIKNGNISSWNRGVSPSQHTRSKLRRAQLGKKLSEATRLKIKIHSAKSKRIQTPQGQFASRTMAAEHYYKQGKGKSSVNATRVWIFSQIKKNPKQWYYIIQ